jgi:hypothetical protein
MREKAKDEYPGTLAICIAETSPSLYQHDKNDDVEENEESQDELRDAKWLVEKDCSSLHQRVNIFNVSGENKMKLRLHI